MSQSLSKSVAVETELVVPSLLVAGTLAKSRQRYLLGIGLVMTFVVMSSAKEVFVGNVVQHFNPFFLVASCFAIISAFFTVVQLRSDRTLYRSLSLRDVVLLNITTTTSWVGFFYALKYMEPAVVSAINTAIGPAATLAASRMLRPSSKVLRIEVLCSLGILVTLSLLVWLTLHGESAVGGGYSLQRLVGVGASITGGLSIVGNTILSKRLSEKGTPTTLVMAVRFYLLVGCALALWLGTEQDHKVHPKELWTIAGVAILGIMIPLFALQKGIEKSEPITVSLLISIAPLFTLIGQAFDKRLAFSVPSFLGILITVGFVAFSIVARHRSMR